MNPVKINPFQSYPLVPLEAINDELEIHHAAQNILQSNLPLEEKERCLAALRNRRIGSMDHVPVCGLKGSVLFFNVNQIGLAPTPLCQAFRKMRVPTISNYGVIGANIGTMMLNPNAIECVPRHIREKMGDLSDKQVEILWTAVDGRPFAKGERCINLCTHPWSHPYALKGDDIHYDVTMGAFPEMGFCNQSDAESIAFNGLSPMNVHVHPDNWGTMLYSPDNAHFAIIPYSPFGVLWAVTQKDNRVAFTKMLVLFDLNHPISESLLGAIKHCDSLEAHLQSLKGSEKAIDQTFNRLLKAEKEGLLEEFRKLPLSFQYGIFREVWLLLHPPAIHHDFGKASFERDPSLAAEFHCSDEQRTQAVNNFVTALKMLLIDSQYELIFHSQNLIKSDSSLKMLECAQLIEQSCLAPLKERNIEQAMYRFNQFSDSEKKRVFGALWEISGCPRGNPNFGEELFYNEILSQDNLRLKSQPLVLAASRQITPNLQNLLQQPLVEPRVFSEPEEPIEALVLTPVIPQASAPEPIEEPILESPTLEAPTAKVINPPVILEEEPIHSMPIALTPQQVLEQTMLMVFSDDFLIAELGEKKERILGLLHHLPETTRNAIYGKVYEYSSDSDKGGMGWGELHVADSLDVLIDALQDVLI